jgi:NAD(P)-dependent dehydrogenase (short-subunit alcohol dehydrogenase family)
MVDDKVAVVAGVGPGIGARFVETFAQGGYRVALARNPSSLDQSSTTPLSSTSTARTSDSKINAKPGSSPPR